MARKKEKAKPLFAVKFAFADSLDALCHEAIMFLQAVDFAIKHGEMKPAVAEALQERHDAFRACLSEDFSDPEDDVEDLR